MSLVIFGIICPWLVVTLCVALGAWVGFQLIHQNGRLLSRLEGLEARLAQLAAAPARAAAPPVPAPPAAAAPAPSGLALGSPAPAFELPDLSGEQKSLADFLGRKLLLIFFNPGCGFCTRMAPDLAALPVDEADGRPIPLVVSTGDAGQNRQLAEENGIRCPVLLQQGMEVGTEYRCHGTPMGYLLDEQGRIASELAVGAQALLELARAEPPVAAERDGPTPLGGRRSLAESKIERGGLPAGTPAPPFRLPLLSGGELSLEENRGRPVLLVFSSPKCGPCDQLMPPLEQAYRRSGHVQVLMVSRDEAELNQAKAEQHGLTFPVVLQRQWEISKEYGMFATPIAYLIDKTGLIAADVAVGPEPILALLASAAGPNLPALLPATDEGGRSGPTQAGPGSPLGSGEGPGAGSSAAPRCKCGKPLAECGCGKQQAKAAAARRNGR